MLHHKLTSLTAILIASTHSSLVLSWTDFKIGARNCIAGERSRVLTGIKAYLDLQCFISGLCTGFEWLITLFIKWLLDIGIAGDKYKYLKYISELEICLLHQSITKQGQTNNWTNDGNPYGRWFGDFLGFCGVGRIRPTKNSWFSVSLPWLPISKSFLNCLFQTLCA